MSVSLQTIDEIRNETLKSIGLMEVHALLRGLYDYYAAEDMERSLKAGNATSAKPTKDDALSRQRAVLDHVRADLFSEGTPLSSFARLFLAPAESLTNTSPQGLDAALLRRREENGLVHMQLTDLTNRLALGIPSHAFIHPALAEIRAVLTSLDGDLPSAKTPDARDRGVTAGLGWIALG